MSGEKRKRNVLNVKQKLEIIQKVDNGESASTDAEDVLNKGNTISHSAALRSVETLLDYIGRDCNPAPISIRLDPAGFPSIRPDFSHQNYFAFSFQNHLYKRC
ncbi:hypothetical protein AVEN_197102-1 [Araneus ventricosus]|uniref:HTH psq-type domain-containing protein n=1 Tax=Araneus ventricosus TaxID=182803 RepID=A0A4Y2J0Z5_ARAVE|nr:hypothetical protein AVEN_197102-1 [Araneus ventricosus]